MADKLWVGGASTVAQVQTDVFAGGAWTGDGTILATMTSEDGTSTQTVSLATTAVSSEAQLDLFLSSLQGSSDTMFQAVTFSKSGADTILSTASVAGTPFYLAITEFSDDTTGTITEVKDGTGASVLSEGPSDWNVDGSGQYTGTNWRTGGDTNAVKPADSDTVRISTGSYDIRYGLFQSSIDLNELRITPGYKGSIGQGSNSIYLRIDVTSSGAQAVTVNSRGQETWLDTTCPDVHVLGGPAGVNLLQLAGDVDNLHISGPVNGTITCKAAMVLDNVYVTGAPRAVVNLGAAITSLDQVWVDSGTVTINDCAIATNSAGDATERNGINVMGTGTVIHKGDLDTSVCPRWRQMGGHGEYNGQGTLTELIVYAGHFTLNNSTADAVTVSTTNQHGGTVTDDAGIVNATWTTFNRDGGGGVVSGADIKLYSQS